MRMTDVGDRPVSSLWRTNWLPYMTKISKDIRPSSDELAEGCYDKSDGDGEGRKASRGGPEEMVTGCVGCGSRA